jgi:hypothetical protein
MLVRALNQQVIQADLAELVDDDDRIGQIGGRKQAVEHRRLAAAQKPGQHGDRNPIVGDHGPLRS